MKFQKFYLKMRFKLQVLLIIIISNFIYSSSHFLLSDCPESCTCDIEDYNTLNLICDLKPKNILLPNDFDLNRELNLITKISMNGEVEYFPQNICSYINLEVVQFQKNRLRYLNSLECLKNLKFVYLDDNEIAKISTNDFNNLQDLFLIQLQNNKINTIETDAFKDLLQLLLLDLTNNVIEKIENNAFNNLPKLFLLDVSNNFIKNIHQPFKS